MNPSPSLNSLKGLGPKRVAVLRASGIESLQDLYDCFPRRYLDRRTLKAISSLREGESVTVVGTIVSTSIERGRHGRGRFKAVMTDGSATLELTWFQGVRYISNFVSAGDGVAVHGKVHFFGRQAQMQHPDFERLSEQDEGTSVQVPGDYELFHMGKIIPLYPSTEAMKVAGLTSRSLRTIILRAFESFPPGSEEHLSSEIIRKHGLMPVGEAYREIHFPSSPEALERARYRLKWSELFFAQLIFALRHHHDGRLKAAVTFTHSGEKTAKLHAMLPFEVTGAQKNAVREIYRDLKSGRQMNRLLQGDVGSGKTLVAMFAMSLAADNGLQSAFMAPTEILAFQHYVSLKHYFLTLGLQVALLKGKLRKKEREELLGRLERGEIDILVGTHAVLEDSVKFSRLGLVIIDEQHRFGVLQRKALQDKSLNPHVLLMTATPIPRTLSMGVYGDLDVTVIGELPPGRKPVETRLCRESARDGVYGMLRREIAEGRQAYIIYPLVEESEKMDLKAATESFQQLQAEIFPDLRLGLIHGQMDSREKESVMEAFRNGDIDVLVGTTVIEVGVDVPNATVMIIEHAERFGLAQLHQLRGRIGRGAHRSSCFLVYAKLTEDARERLHAMASTSDGFRLSEIDMQMRGAGNILGKEQSGMESGFRIADLLVDFGIMESARTAAFALVEEDSQLRLPQHVMIRNHYLRHCHERFSLADIG